MLRSVSLPGEDRPRADTLRRLPGPAGDWRLLLAAIAAALLARLAFWLMTGRVWEDALITITHARNAAAGLGLTHHPGEGHVHGFTSALSVLVPFVGELVHRGSGLFALRLVTLAATVVSLGFAYLIARDLRLDRWAIAFVLLYLALDENQIFFGMAGMETQMAVAVLLAGIFFVLRGSGWASGIFLGLAPLVRPDFLIWAIPALASLGRSRRAAVQAWAVALGVVTPWLVFTVLYYGSPIPQTIRAKANAYVDLPALSVSHLVDWVTFLGHRVVLHLQSWRYLAPFVENDAAVRTPVPTPVLLMVAIVFIWLVVLGLGGSRRIPGWRPALAYAGLFLAYRVVFLEPTYFAWYLPPFLAILALLAGGGLTAVIQRSRPLGRGLAVVLATLFALHIPFSFPLQATIQHQIEDRARAPLGQYLGRVVQPGEGVVSESAGYVGYGGLHGKLYDFPGLTSPRAYSVLRAASFPDRNLTYLVVRLQPEWLVLRPWELAALQADYPTVAERYVQAERFRVAVPVERWGLVLSNIDEDFYVMRRD